MQALLFFLAFAGFLLAAAHRDAASLRIPNGLTLAMAVAAFPAVVILGDGFTELPAHIGAGLAALLLGILLFSFGVLGGGDGKLIAAAALWLGPDATLRFLVLTAVFGAVLAVAVLALRPWAAGVRPTGAGLGREMPYAMAIAPAGLVALLLKPDFLG